MELILGGLVVPISTTKSPNRNSILHWEICFCLKVRSRKCVSESGDIARYPLRENKTDGEIINTNLRKKSRPHGSIGSSA